MGTEKSDSSGCTGIIVFLLLSVAGAWWFIHRTNEAEKRDAAANEARAAERIAEAQEFNKPIVIKGLYIGMPITELPNVVATKFAGWNLYNGDKITYATDFSITKVSVFGLDSIRVACDSSRKVVLITFDAKVSEYAFNAQNMTARQFVQAFVNAYPVPTMEPRAEFWECLRPQDNVLVRIDDNKRVLLQKVTNPDALKPRFD